MRFRVAFGLAGGVSGGALFGFLGLDRDCGGAQLALQIGRALFDSVKFGAMLVAEVFELGQLGHSATLAALPLAKLAQPLLIIRHVGVILCEE